MKALRVLSLFDGISCGMVALERAGIPVEKYYASEIVSSAITISKNNYPQIIQLGDITQITEQMLDEIMPIDLIIGGSPCQDLSIYKFDRGEVTGLNGEKSGLFYHYMRILKYVNPRFFLLENVPMEEKWKNEISNLLEVEPILINSNLVCAADRKRLYWTNIPNITQPDDKGIVLNDIVIPSQNVPEKYWYSKPFVYNGDDCKVQCTLELNGHRHIKEVYNLKGKCSTLTTCAGGNLQKKVYQDGRCRKLTPLEYERLQTLPDGYTDGVADTHRYNAIGNGWTVDVITHIFNNLKEVLFEDSNDIPLKLLSLFSGIGAFEKALKNLNINYDLIAYSEIDKYASKSYSAIHNVNESLNLGDITKVNEKELPKDIDLITYGFPCQDISLAGKQKGLFNEDGTQTRSGLFFDALRIIEEIQPKVAIAENVKNLVGKKFKSQFEIVLKSLEDAGYNQYWKILNSREFGIPQNRERVFIVSIRKDIDTEDFQFPQGFPLKLRLKDMLDDIVDEKYYISERMLRGFIEHNERHKEKGTGFIWKPRNLDGCASTLRANASLCPTDNTIDVNEMINTKDIQSSKKINMQKLKDIKLSGAYGRDFGSRGKLQDTDGICDTLVAAMGTGGGNVPIVVDDEYEDKLIQRIDVPQLVKIRKYEVNINKLCECLRYYKQKSNLSNNNIANKLNIPQTKVEHWFRRDKHFAIPDAEIWFSLKKLLDIETNEFDESIMTFEEKEGIYEKSERHYFADGIAPTLTSSSASAEKIIISENDEPKIKVIGNYSPSNHDASRIVDENGIASTVKENHGTVTATMHNFRIRKLTPKECFRLQGFDDYSFSLAEKVNSNTQLYKQAGNSITVPVIEHIIKALFDCNLLN